jgi:hypothetical protein
MASASIIGSTSSLSWIHLAAQFADQRGDGNFSIWGGIAELRFLNAGMNN